MSKKGGGNWCAVFGCSNYRKKDIEGISFHRFPKDPKLKKEWILKCYRADKFNADSPSISICSTHFKEEDFERDFKAELLNTKPKRLLKKGSIPSQNLPRNHSQKTSSSIKRNQNMMAKELKQKQKETISSLLLQSSSEVPDSIKTESSEIQQEKNCKEIVELKEEIASLKSLLEEKNKTVEELNKNKTNAAEKMLQGVFSSNQIKLIFGKKKKVKWTEEEIAKAFTLRYISKRAYLYVKDELLYPLPGISSLKRWSKNLGIKRGMLRGVFSSQGVNKHDLRITKFYA